MSGTKERPGYVAFRFELTDDDFRLLKRLAQYDDRTKAGLLRVLIRQAAAARGIVARPAPAMAVAS